MDQTLFHLINEKWTNPALDLFMGALSDSAIWRPFIIAIALFALFIGGFKARACILTILVTMLIVEQVTGTLKSLVARPRPRQAQSVRLVELQKASPKILTLFKKPSIHYSDEGERNHPGASFPSGHMANNTAIAVCCTVFYRRRGWLYWVVAGLIGYSRIYLGAHWPSDVFATVFLAAGETLIIIGILELIWRTAARRWAPQIFARHPSLVVRHGESVPGRIDPTQ
ncbi:MAG: phosphatase PAP2 family protein [Verrucomicrobiota bacterium]